MQYLSISEIKVEQKFQIFPANHDDVITSIQKNMEDNGFDEATPIVLWNNVIIDGHTRFAAAQEAGLEKLPCIMYDFDDEDDAIDYAIHMQRDRRNLTDDALYYAYEKIDERKERGGDHGNQYTNEKRQSNASVTLPKTHFQTADKLGIGSTKVQKMRAISDHADDKTKEEIKSGEKSINKAYEETQYKRKKEEKEKAQIQPDKKEKKFTETEDGIFIAEEVKNPKSVFNEQPEEKITIITTSIEWAKWSWNPVTGCLHGCKYCYARDIANRFSPTKFAPTFYPDRLTAPERMKIPEHRKNEEGINTVFVCSMADLFGEWVPQEWIDKVIAAVKEYKEWNFIFLTKNPKKYIGIEWPENAWVGTTVDTQARVEAAVEAFSHIEASVKFLSCEPLKEHLQFNADEYDKEGEWLSVFDWVIIGGQSESSGMEASQPQWEWVESLHNQARNAKCAIYWKPNLTIKPKEYPSIDI